MYKKINGKDVDVNVELFSMFARGKVEDNITLSKVSEQIDEQEKTIANIIKAYNNLVNSMPYLLQKIESDVKYAVLGYKLKVEHCVEDGLHIRLGNTIVSFKGNVWSIRKGSLEKSRKWENMEGEEGYDLYKYWLEHIGKDSDFYKDNFRELYDACRGDNSIIEYELDNMLTFETNCAKVNLEDNRILDIDEGIRYLIDFYYEGAKETGLKENCIDLTNKGKISKINEMIDIYNYKVYSQKKKMGINGNEDYGEKKIENNIFEDIYATMVRENKQNGSKYIIKGLKFDDNIFYEIGDNVYVSDGKYSEKIVKGGRIYGIKTNKKGLNVVIESKKREGRVEEQTYYVYVDKMLMLAEIKYLGV